MSTPPFGLGFSGGVGVGSAPVTAQDMIQDALEMLMVYAAGEVMSAADAARGLKRLNQMMDSWSNEKLTMFDAIEQSVALVAGKSQYSIGAGGYVSAPRPMWIDNGPGTAYVQDANGNNYRLAVVERDAWNQIGNRSILVTSNIPDTLFYDRQFPLGLLNFYPFPNIGGYTAFWDSWSPLSTFPGLAGVLNLPPGYEMAIVSNLAVALKPYFVKAQLDPLVVKEAMESKANLKRVNSRAQQIAFMDDAIVANAGSSYNIYTDGYSN